VTFSPPHTTLQAETCDNDIIYLKKLGSHRREIRHILDLSGEQYQLIKQVFDEEGYLEHP
jgi:hypothetical protein